MNINNKSVFKRKLNNEKELGNKNLTLLLLSV